jgi:hypothetical protein
MVVEYQQQENRSKEREGREEVTVLYRVTTLMVEEVQVSSFCTSLGHTI